MFNPMQTFSKKFRFWVKIVHRILGYIFCSQLFQTNIKAQISKNIIWIQDIYMKIKKGQDKIIAHSSKNE